jgi:uncharacterized metal-binding protein YceD (DUF177 family)
VKFSLRELEAKGELHLAGSHAESILALSDSAGGAIEWVGPLTYDLQIYPSETSGYAAVGSLEVACRLTCVVCLEPFDFLAQNDDFSFSPEEMPKADEVDLTEPLREDILIVLPDYPHCDTHGGRACPGQPPLKQGGADAPEAGVFANGGRPDPWSALDQVKLPPERE